MHNPNNRKQRMEGRSVLAMNISSGKIQIAQKVVIYGPEGIGKTLFASHFPTPLYIDTEGSTKNYDVNRFDEKPTSWEMLKQQVTYVKHNKPCKTLVIDTIDWAEQLCIDYICSSHDKKGIEDFGYGNGYVYEKEEIGRFLNSLDEVIKLGINVVLTAHAQMRKFEQPDELGAYDRWELKLGKKTGSQISPLVKEWADIVLFANYETFAVQADKDGKRFKAQGGNRVMYTQHHPCWDAKNRFGLNDKLPFDYKEIAHIFTQSEQIQVPKVHTEPIEPQIKPFNPNDYEDIPTEEPPENVTVPQAVPDDIPPALADLMRMNEVSDEDIRFVVAQKGYYPENTPIKKYGTNFINGVLVGAWEQVYSTIKENKKEPFLGY